MTLINRRNLTLGSLMMPALTGFTATVGLGGFTPTAQAAVDMAKLNQASPLGDMILGAADAKVTLIEYASATCPHCANFSNTVFPTFQKEYIDTGKVRFIFREFPIDQLALAAFMTVRCAPKDQYFPLMRAVFQTQKEWVTDPLNGLYKIMQQAGMTKADFDACLKNQQLANDVIATGKQGSELGVKGVPAFFLNGELLEGEMTFAALQAKIDPLLK